MTASALGELMRLQREAVGPALPLDAIAFVLHGAMVAESEDDVESRVLAGVRDVVGDLPIVKGVKTPI